MYIFRTKVKEYAFLIFHSLVHRCKKCISSLVSYKPEEYKKTSNPYNFRALVMNHSDCIKVSIIQLIT